MRRWFPLVLGGVILAAYAYFYQLTVLEAQGAASMQVANFVGLAFVFVGIILAALVLRRAAPPG